MVWDAATGRPLHNAIVWLDNRTSGICHEMSARLPGGADHFRPVTGGAREGLVGSKWLAGRGLGGGSGKCQVQW